jgi:hypothetical protein
MTKIKITQEILDYIKENSIRFSEVKPSPVLGEEWKVVAWQTYPNVNSGNPVFEIEREDGCFMRLPEHIVHHYIIDNETNFVKV